jgi:hypothetical protein
MHAGPIIGRNFKIIAGFDLTLIKFIVRIKLLVYFYIKDPKYLWRK